MIRRLAVLTAALAATLIPLAACSHNTKPSVDIEARRMVIIPMKDRLQYHFDSARGISLAQLVTERLEEKRRELGEEEVMAVVPFEEMTKAVTQVHQDPKDIPHADLGRMVKADLVLVGDIERFETRVPGQIGMLSGRATVNLNIIEVAKPDRTLKRLNVQVTYPKELFGGTGVVTPAEGEEADVEQGLMRALVDEIAKKFYAGPDGKTVLERDRERSEAKGN